MALEHNHNLVAPGLGDRRVLQAEVLWMGTYVDFGAAPNFAGNGGLGAFNATAFGMFISLAGKADRRVTATEKQA